MSKIYDEITGEVIENPDLTAGKLYSVDIVIGHEPAKVVVMDGTITPETPEGLKEYIPERDIIEVIDRYHKYTIDELIQQQDEQKKKPDYTISQEKKIELFINSLLSENCPPQMPKVGCKWEPYFAGNKKGFKWHEVDDPDAFGTQAKPLYWKSGMAITTDYCYKDIDNNVKTALKDGVPESFEDEEYFKSI